ncbi:tetratricopeptide repeat-containing sulfotransferase family protein [Hyphococcus luteus]|uniref:Sulfotransferase n=1 Tax=Hyphococcus luteus TaxID=2058213 RepID=A0A2S7K4P7_9PROT|nr:sulfotransferase [Marinicaulis flavus]PQA87469.1 sulfotransferase [Marinicaulis flavus]
MRGPGTGARADIAAALQEGFAALNAGEPKKAADACRRALSMDRANPEAHFLVGLVAVDMQDYKTAVSAFGSVTKIKPDHAAAWAQLAQIFMRLGQPGRAEQTLEKAKAAFDGDAAVADLVGMVSSSLGDQAAAKDWYQRAIDKAPDRPVYKVNLATALTFLGETQAAEDTLTALLKDNEDIAQAQWLLSSVKKAEDPSRADMLMEKAGAVKDAHSRAFLAYGAGKEYEDCEQWAKAFAAFDAGAKAKRATLDYDEKADEARFDALKSAFTGEWAGEKREGHDDPSPIFVVGQPRTGTTLIERIITSHSMVESAGELQQFGLSVRRLSEGAFADRWAPEAIAASAHVDAAALGKEYLRASAVMRKGAPRFVDKLPGNYFHIPLILAALPNARIVHLTRNPMDSCFASFKQLFAEAYFHSYDQLEMARHHARYLKLMDHWRALFPQKFLDISYEETVADTEPNARRLIDFLGLGWEDQCLSFHEQKGAVATASAVQVREKPHSRSVGRWRRYQAELAPMHAELAAAGVRGLADAKEV